MGICESEMSCEETTGKTLSLNSEKKEITVPESLHRLTLTSRTTHTHTHTHTHSEAQNTDASTHILCAVTGVHTIIHTLRYCQFY